MTIKIVLNKCYGGFGLSDKAVEMLNEIKVETKDSYEWGSYFYGFKMRCDPSLVSVVEILGEKASGPHADLRVEEVYFEPSIGDYDGIETINY